MNYADRKFCREKKNGFSRAKRTCSLGPDKYLSKFCSMGLGVFCILGAWHVCVGAENSPLARQTGNHYTY